MDEIKAKLDGQRLLKQLSHTHGLMPELYEVVPGNGGDRIRCGSKTYNVTDFCTKEMHLPFADAAPILRQCYAEQKRALGVDAKPRPREVLWQDFRANWTPEYRTRRAEAMAAQKVRATQQRNDLTARFRIERSKVTANRAMKPAEKQAERSVIRVRQVEAKQALSAQHAKERVDLAKQYPARPEFTDYLREKAQAGSIEALTELRRQRRPQPIEHDGLAVKSRQPEQATPFEQLSYRVSRNGEVTYYDRQGDVLRDEAKTVAALRNDDATVATALRIAQQKFYEPGQKGATEISLHGSEAQIRKAIEVAARENIPVRFADPKHEAMRQDLQATYRAGREFIAEQKRGTERKNPPSQPTFTQENQRQSGPARDDSTTSDKGRGDRGMGR